MDSAWIKLEKKAARTYQKLYRNYADTIRNLQYLNDAISKSNAYATQMYLECEYFVKFYPHYEMQLRNQYIAVYDRDYKRLAAIFKDYPIYHINLYGDTIVTPMK